MCNSYNDYKKKGIPQIQQKGEDIKDKPSTSSSWYDPDQYLEGFKEKNDEPIKKKDKPSTSSNWYDPDQYLDGFKEKNDEDFQSFKKPIDANENNDIDSAPDTGNDSKKSNDEGKEVNGSGA